jgi:hypothetical protein
VAGQPDHVAKAPPFNPKGVVVELKREMADGKGGTEGEGSRSVTNHWPTGHAWPLNPYFSSYTSSFSYHDHFTDQKHIKQSQFLSSFLFIYFKFLDFILYNDEINMLWKRKK